MSKPNLKVRVRQNRELGYSLNELAKEFGISKSTASLWVRDIELNSIAKAVIEKKIKKGQAELRKNHHKARIRRTKEINIIKNKTHEDLNKTHCSLELKKLMCSLLFWAEGCKDGNSVRFANSDPLMVKLFIKLLKEGFNINGNKLKVLVHIHSYHNDQQIKQFWADVTDIPLSNFYKSYIKLHTGKRKHYNYKGCVVIYYHDYKVAQELMHLYNAFAKQVT